jgi:hypothetical protein
MELHGMRLPESLKTPSISINEKGENYLSLYEGELDERVLIENIAKIKASFPELPIQFYSILANRIKEKGFSSQKLIDAVNNVIDNCVYPVPTIANFLSFDKKIRLFTYQEMLKKIHESCGDSTIWDLHEKKRINETTFWYLKTDL